MFDLEDLLLTLLSGVALTSRLKSLRDDYQEVFGKDAWDKIQPTLLALIDPAKDVENLAEARRLQEELHWQASIRPWASHTRQRMIVDTPVVTVLVLVGACIVAAFCVMKFESVMIFAGVLGGAVSSIQRIQSANLASSRALMLARYTTLRLGVLISPLLGGIFAVMMSLILMSKTVAPGTVIPNVVLGYTANNSLVRNSDEVIRPMSAAMKLKPAAEISSNAPETGVENITAPATTITKTNEPASQVLPSPEEPVVTEIHRPFQPEQPVPCRYSFFSMPVIFASGQDLALFLLWMFLAGFSERLVPDLLTRLGDSKKR